MTDTSLRQMLRQSLATFETRIDPAETAASLDIPCPPISPDADGLTPAARRLCLHLLAALDVQIPDEDSEHAQDSSIIQGQQLLQTALALDALYADGSLKLHTPHLITLRKTAILLYRLAIALSPAPKAYNNIAVLYADADNESLALEWLERGLERFPSDTTLRSNFDLLNDD